MIRPIVKDTVFLSRKSEPATINDKNIIEDLQDTLKANSDRCVGMAANMIGYRKRVIIVAVGMIHIAMVNPKIVKRAFPYETEEGCLSLDGVRKTTRYNEIEVEYSDTMFKKHRSKFSGNAAQIIQHETDHLEGILI